MIRVNKLSIVIFALALSACSLNQSETPSAFTETPTQASEVVEPSLPAPTLTSPPSTTHLEPPSINEALIPNGFLWADPATGAVTLADPSGQTLQTLQIPQYVVGYAGAPLIHVAGSVKGRIAPPVIFFASRLSPVTSYDGEKLESWLTFPADAKVSIVSTLSIPRQHKFVTGVIDMDSQAAFKAARYAATPSANQPQPTLRSWLYAWKSSKSPAFEIVLSREDPNGFVMHPLAITWSGEEMTGIWYSLEFAMSHGGGPVFFKGYEGLFYLDLATGQVSEFPTSPETKPMAISPDASLVAMSDFSAADTPLIHVINLNTGDVQQTLTAMPNTVGFTNTSVGSIHFSPSNQGIAWAGVIDRGEDGISTSIQVVSLVDDTAYSILEQDLAAQLDEDAYHTFNVVGWLNDQTVLVEAQSTKHVAVYSFRLDDKTWQHLADGYFVGFTYP